MKVKFKDILDMEFTSEEGKLATEFYTKAVELEAKTSLPTGIPLTTEEFLKQQERHKTAINAKERTISDLLNRVNQLTDNNTVLKSTVESLKAKLEGSDTKDELETAYETIRAKNDEIASLKAKIRELENKPGEYSTGMADALKNSNLITPEEHEEAINRVSMGRDINLYWNEFETYAENYVDCPVLVTDFGRFNVVNMTPHPVTLTGVEGGTLVIGPSDHVTRIEMDQQPVKLDNSDLPLVVEAKGKFTNMPIRRKNTLYIVSRIVFDAATDREDFICPNVMKATRNQNNVVTSIPSFICRKKLIERGEE